MRCIHIGMRCIHIGCVLCVQLPRCAAFRADFRLMHLAAQAFGLLSRTGIQVHEAISLCVPQWSQRTANQPDLRSPP